MATEKDPSSDLKIACAIHRNQLLATISNQTIKEKRLWEQENSWGWNSTSVEVNAEGRERAVLRRCPREWTKNGPSFLRLRPGAHWEVVVNLGDGWWQAVNEVKALSNETLHVRVKYHVDQTPESQGLDVFAGTIISNWVCSTPPQRWLLPLVQVHAEDPKPRGD